MRVEEAADARVNLGDLGVVVGRRVQARNERELTRAGCEDGLTSVQLRRAVLSLMLSVSTLAFARVEIEGLSGRSGMMSFSTCSCP